MRSAVILADDSFKKKKISLPVLDRQVLDFVVFNLLEAGAETVYLVSDESIPCQEALVVTSLEEAISLINDKEGEILIIDDIYPFIKAKTYAKVLALKRGRIEGTNIIKTKIADIKSINKEAIDVVKTEETELLDILIPSNYQSFTAYWHDEIIAYHSGSGVIFCDPRTTYIGPLVKMEEGVIIEGNVSIYGACFIGRGTKITSGSYINDSYIGQDNQIISSRITDSRVFDHNTIGPSAHLRMGSEVMGHCRIGNYVEFKRCRFGEGSRCAHLTYLGDCEVGVDVNIGCGVVTCNYDGACKHKTYIGDHSFIGSNANLIAPIHIGSYALVAAGSTVTKDVPDNDMAIARAYETYKKGYGYTYINKEK